jgi:hypothetical protein
MRCHALFSKPVALLLVSGCGLTGGDFPSLVVRQAETPRSIASPGAAAVPTLSEAEQSGLQADLLREEKALAKTSQQVSDAQDALAPLLAAARGAPIGSESWTQAQLALSRFDQARAPLGEIDGRLAPLKLVVDSLPEDNSDRQKVEALAARARAAMEQAARRAEAANRALAKA